MIDYKKKMTIGKAKKILRGFLAKDCYYDTPLYYAIPYSLDYITNLQEELKSANESITWWSNRFKAVERDKKDYKSRIDKAVEYIKDSGITFLNLADQRCFCNNNCADKIINILNGSDE